LAAAVAEEDLEAIMAAQPGPVHIKQVELVDLMEVAVVAVILILLEQMEVLVLSVSFGQDLLVNSLQLM
jgi:hypothetical protein